MEAATAAEVASVIGTLMTGRDLAAQREANVWLNRFTTTHRAWEVSAQLVLAPATEISFFAANMLLTKVRQDWSSLQPEMRQQLTTGLGAMLPSVTSAVVRRRLCLVLAAAATRIGGDAVVQLCQQAVALACDGAAHAQLPLATALLTALAEEVHESAHTRRAALVAAALPFLPAALAACERIALIQDGEYAASGPPDAFRAALAWLRLEPSGTRLALSPGQLYATRQALVAAALRALPSEDDTKQDLATDLLAEVLQPGAAGDSDAAEAAAATATITALLGLRETALAEDEEHVARCVCRVATALGERHVGPLTRGEGAFVQLVSLVFDLAGRPERIVMEKAADFFLLINTVPVAERHPQLRAPLFRVLLERCLAHAALPPAMVAGWRDAGLDEDEDGFHRFREQVLADLLESVYGMLRAECLGVLAERCSGAAAAAGAQTPAGAGGGAAGAPTWQAAEAAVFCLRAMALPVKERALTGRTSDLADPAVAADREATNGILHALFARVAEGPAGGVFWRHPLLVESTSRLVGAHAAWFGAAQGSPVHGALRYLLAALQVPEATPHAAAAFRNVCARCAARLAEEPSQIMALIALTQTCMPPPPPLPAAGADVEEDARVPVVEALARVASRLPLPEATAAALSLVEPVVGRARATLASVPDGTQPSAAQAHALTCELQLVASAVRFVECGAAGPGERHAALALLEAGWDVLSAVGERDQWRASAPVVAALCELYTRAMNSAKGAAAVLLPALLSAVLGAFDAYQHASCLDTLAAAVETFCDVRAAGAAGGGSVTDPALETALDAALTRVVSVTAARMATRQPAAEADVLRALFECANRYLLFAPAILLRSGALPALFGLATATVTLRERESVAPVLNLLSNLLSPGRQMAASGDLFRACRPTIDAIAAAQGAPLTSAALVAAAGTCPRSSLRQLGAVLYALLNAYPEPAASWIVTVVQQPGYPAALAEGAAELDEQQKRLFLAAALRQPRLPQPRFEALVVDFAALCRREGGDDALVAYQE